MGGWVSLAEEDGVVFGGYRIPGEEVFGRVRCAISSELRQERPVLDFEKGAEGLDVVRGDGVEERVLGTHLGGAASSLAGWLK